MSNKCQCGYEFDIHDINGLKRVDDHRFYGGNVKHYSETECPECHTKTKLFLKQVGQTYEIKGISQEQIQESNEENLTCTVCNKVFKSKAGLARHLQMHQE